MSAAAFRTTVLNAAALINHTINSLMNAAAFNSTVMGAAALIFILFFYTQRGGFQTYWNGRRGPRTGY